MAEKKKSLVFMDLRIYAPPYRRMVFELFSDIAPFAAENFRALCTGEKGASPKTKERLRYIGCFFHEVEEGGSYVKGGAHSETGEGGESIYGPYFPVDEPNELKHDKEGLLSMSRQDRETSSSHFIITLKADPRLDSSHFIFGKLLGLDTLWAIAKYGINHPPQIYRSGVLYNASQSPPNDVMRYQPDVAFYRERAQIERKTPCLISSPKGEKEEGGASKAS